MRSTTIIKRFAGFTLATFAICLCLYSHAAARYGFDQARHQTGTATHAIIVNLLKKQHTFVAPSDTTISYGGRWQQGSGLLTRESGSYVDVIVTNTTSVYIATDTLGKAFETQNEPHESRPQAGHLFVQVSDRPYRRHTLSQQLSKVATDLDRTQAHRVRILFHRNSGQPNNFMVSSQGFWLDHGGSLVHKPRETPDHIEAVTNIRADRFDAFPALLASRFNMSHSIISAANRSLTATEENTSSLQKTFFGLRHGQLDAPAAGFAHRFSTSRPSAILLELGTSHIMRLLSRQLPDKAFSKELDVFVKDYAAFVKSIRAVAHEYQPSSAAFKMIPGTDASLAYNSQRSNMPIILLTPLDTIDLLRDVNIQTLSRVVRSLRAEGDLGTTWLDTDGWLATEGFVESDEAKGLELNAQGHQKVADTLATHLCPLLKGGDECPFHRPSSYDGTLYLPSEAGLGKLLEERKIQLIREALDLPAASL